MSYQWMLDGQPLPGATNTSLTISNVQPANVGNYVVIVSNSFFTVQSAPAFLQISAIAPNASAQLVQAVYKLGDVFSLGAPQPDPAPSQPQDGSGESGPVVGLSGSQYCSTRSTSTSYAVFGIEANDTYNGSLLITTEGSGFANYFWVSNGPANALQGSPLTLVTNAYVNGYQLSSRTNIMAVSGQTYYVYVYGAGTASGKATINWTFNYHPSITRPPYDPPSDSMYAVLGNPGVVLTDTPAWNNPAISVTWFTNQVSVNPANPKAAGTGATLAPTASLIYSVSNYLEGAVNPVTQDLVYEAVVGDSLSATISGGDVVISYGPNTAAIPLYIESSSTCSPTATWALVQTLAKGASAGTLSSTPLPPTGSTLYYRITPINPNP
jgi:hypothetical protein